jgi:hypothetical protein
MSAKHFFALIVIVLMSGSFISRAGTPAPADAGTGINGVIAVSPVHGGPSHVGVSDSAPLAKTTWTVKSENGPITSFTTDEQGRFQVSLPPGHYTVSKEGGGRSIGRFGPFEVDVVAGKMTSVQWQCDSGIR